MTHFLLSVGAFVLTIGVLVSFHEFGHFWVARRFGIKVLRFSIGFGKPFAKWHGRHRDQTEYWLATIPLGGYVKLLDAREGPVPEEDLARAFNRQSPPKRIAVMLAGPGFNFLFAILAYWVMFVAGVPAVKPYIGDVRPASIAALAGIRAGDEITSVGGAATPTWESASLRILDDMLGEGVIPLTVVAANGNTRHVELDVQGKVSALTAPNALFPGLGIVPGLVRPSVVGAVTSGGPAAQAGLQAGDRIVAVDGKAIASFEVLGQVVRQHQPGDVLKLTVTHDDTRAVLPVTVAALEQNGQHYVGIGIKSSAEVPKDWATLAAAIRTEQRYGVGQSLVHSVDKTWEMSAMTVRMLVQMIAGDVSVRNLSGPIAIADYAGDSAQAGFGAFLGFLAVVSISLGILNLLPIPILDGGQVVYQIIEWVKGSPLSERAMIFGQQVGIGLLVVLMVFVFYNDLTRVFS